jgi:UDP-glucose:(heptosyl)LPS alpha-1,3-glucosyltransferase
MKIALNIETVGARRGGAEKYAGSLARWLAAIGHEIHVAAREVDAGELPPEVTVLPIKPFCPPGLGAFRAYMFARASEQALRGRQFDLIVGFVKTWHQHAYLAVAGAHPASLDCNSRRFRSPVARAAWRTLKAISPKQWAFAAIARKQFHGEYRPHIIAPSRMVAEHFQQYHGVSADQISVVYNGLDAAAALPDPATSRVNFRRRLGFTAADVLVLFVARNYELKGLEPLIESFVPVARACPRARLLVCGSTRDVRFRRQVRRLGLRACVHFLGFVDDIRECFVGSDLFAFPTFYDPCSLVVPEAMHAGLPVITTRQNGAGEMLTEGVDGFVVDSPWATDQIADRIVRLARDEPLRRHMSDSARTHVRAFTIEAMQDQLLEAFGRAAGVSIGRPGERKAA